MCPTAKIQNMTLLPLCDQFGRVIRDLRISVTDRCNFRCTYCMPKEQFGINHRFMPRRDLLSFEEIERLVRLFIVVGVRKIRLTGGEPLLRQNLEYLVSLLTRLSGVQDLSLTTNGSLLTAEKACSLHTAGLRRITVSLDSIDDIIFKKINAVDFSSQKILEAIAIAETANLSPVKINMVVKRGVNDQGIVAMAEQFRGTSHIVRFIEYMDVGNTNGWRMDDVVSAREIVDLIAARHPIEPINPNYKGEVAKRWRYLDGQGEFGVISSVTQPFCGDCTRARLSAEGKLYLCLFAGTGYDLKGLLRSGIDDTALLSQIRKIWSGRDDRYSMQRSENTNASAQKIEMSYIGG